MKLLKGLIGAVQDYPLLVNFTILVAVVAHWSSSGEAYLPDTWHPLAESEDGGIAIYLGATSAAAIVAGFAGVVVVFGLTANTSSFRTLRLSAGGSLTRNWTSTSVLGFAAAGLSLVAATVSSLGFPQHSPWLFELSALLLLHGTGRTIWLMRQLVEVVAVEDAKTVTSEKRHVTQSSDFS